MYSSKVTTEPVSQYFQGDAYLNTPNTQRSPFQRNYIRQNDVIYKQSPVRVQGLRSPKVQFKFNNEIQQSEKVSRFRSPLGDSKQTYHTLKQSKITLGDSLQHKIQKISLADSHIHMHNNPINLSNVDNNNFQTYYNTAKKTQVDQPLRTSRNNYHKSIMNNLVYDSKVIDEKVLSKEKIVIKVYCAACQLQHQRKNSKDHIIVNNNLIHLNPVTIKKQLLPSYEMYQKTKKIDRKNYQKNQQYNLTNLKEQKIHI